MKGKKSYLSFWLSYTWIHGEHRKLMVHPRHQPRESLHAASRGGWMAEVIGKSL